MTLDFGAWVQKRAPGCVKFAVAGMVAAMLSNTQAAPAPAAGAPLASVVVKASGGAELAGFDGVVEAVRQTAIAAQVPGAVVALTVKAGDAVKAGQVLARLDARAALQSAAAGDAQARVAGAEREVARRELERQRTLLAKQYISQAAFDRAEARYKAAEAQVGAQLAQAGAARTQSGFYILTAPYAGVVSEVAIVQGDMAMPGRSLMTLHDPQALRVTAAIPEGALAALRTGATAGSARIELANLAPDQRWQNPTRVTVLPAADPATHTVQVRFDLAAGLALAPGMFARVWLPDARAAAARFMVPAQSIVRRAELTALYVLDAGGKPLLRQVRLGRVAGDSVEVLAGVGSGERVATDPQAAARMR